MGLKLKWGSVVALILAASMASADTLELKNGSRIKGKYQGGTDTQVSFQVGSTVLKFNVADIVSLKFDSETAENSPAPQPQSSLPDAPPMEAPAPSPDAAVQVPAAPVETRPAFVTIPAGTQIFVRTIDSIDSSSNQVGDRFQATLEEPLTVEGNVVVPQDAIVYGRLAGSKDSGTFTGRPQLRLELIGIAVNGKMVPVVTGEYEATGKSRGASTARRTLGGAALGAIIGAAADGGEGAAIGAGVGAGAGAGSEIVIRGDQVKVPSESLLDFTLQADLSIPQPQS